MGVGSFFSRGVGTHHDIWIKDIAQVESRCFGVHRRQDVAYMWTTRDVRWYSQPEMTYSRSSLVVASVGKPTEVLCVACSRATGWFKGSQGVFHEEGLPSGHKIVAAWNQEY
jgi:hypothetical protein